MNKAQKKAQKRLKRKKIVEHKKAVINQKKIVVRQKIKAIKAELHRRAENMVVITPEQKAEYVAKARKILNIPDDKVITFEQIVQAMQMARNRFQKDGIEVKGEEEKAE